MSVLRTLAFRTQLFSLRPHAVIPARQSGRHLQRRLLGNTAGSSYFPQQPPQRSLFRRAVLITLGCTTAILAGAIMAVAPVVKPMSGYLTPVSDEESLSIWQPPTEEAQEHEDYINNHPYIRELRAQSSTLTESRPHLKIPEQWRVHNLTGGTLIGPDTMPVPPFAWTDKESGRFIEVLYVGEDLCGHPGIVHGGFLATLLDEGLARACFPRLPNKVGMTASLTVNYRAPCEAKQYIVLDGRTEKVEGRKAWVKGTIKKLPKAEDWKAGMMEELGPVAEAEALYIEPKQAGALAKYYSPE